MKHRIGYNRLNRKASHRKAMINNMVTSLFKHERITTTIAKAQEVRRTAEKMVTKAKIDSVHNRRLIAKRIKDKAVLNKLFTDISVRFKERPGGYTRVLRVGRRNNDAAEMTILELVDKVVEEKKKPKKESKPEPENNEAVETAEVEDSVEEEVQEEVSEAEAPVEKAVEEKPQDEPVNENKGEESTESDEKQE